jgi:hypothetical protein
VRKKGALLAFLSATLLLLAGCGSAPPADGDAALNRLTPQEKADGWILLFDGKTLNGWEDPAKETPPGHSWVVEDGCIKAVADPRLREDLVTLDNFGDFELSFEWKVSPGGNSGVKYRLQDRAVLVSGRLDPSAQRFEDTVEYELAHRLGDRSQLGPNDHMEEYPIAFEYQLIDNERHPDAAEGPDRTAGAIYGLVAPSAQVARPVGEFNQSRIVLRGNHVQHWLNGTKVVDVNLDSDEIRNGLAKRWPKDSQVYRLLSEMPHRQTPITLQNHGDEAWFRNLKIRRLH